SFVSRQHARLTCRGDSWSVHDLGSRNGTQVNGIAVTNPVTLDNGDQIKIVAGGNVEALFHEEIYRMTIFDGLTKVHNKRYLLDFLDREIARARRYESPLALAMLDIDHFKKLNDTYGHQAGDYVLEQVAGAIGSAVRREQLLARYGGEEFAIVLPELTPEQVLAFCENVRARVAEGKYVFNEETLSVTVSVGAAMLTGSMEREQLFQAADAKLYEAKRRGRNRVAMQS